MVELQDRVGEQAESGQSVAAVEREYHRRQPLVCSVSACSESDHSLAGKRVVWVGWAQ